MLFCDEFQVSSSQVVGNPLVHFGIQFRAKVILPVSDNT